MTTVYTNHLISSPTTSVPSSLPSTLSNDNNISRKRSKGDTPPPTLLHSKSLASIPIGLSNSTQVSVKGTFGTALPKNIGPPKMYTQNVLTDVYNIPQNNPQNRTNEYIEKFENIFQSFKLTDYTNYFTQTNANDTEIKRETITDAGFQLVNHYTIGDLSKYISTDQRIYPLQHPPTYCEYDMIDKLKKDLLVGGLINDPFSYNNIDDRLKGNLISSMIGIKDVDIDTIGNVYIPDFNSDIINLTQINANIQDSKSRNSTSISTSTSTDNTQKRKFGTYGGAPYARSPNNKYVQWNTLYGEFLHDFTSTRITNASRESFFGDANVEGIVNKGWTDVFGQTNLKDKLPPQDYDIKRAIALTNAQPLNETKYVQETINTIQRENPDLLYDLNYVPLTTISTGYYPINGTPESTADYASELRELYNTFKTSFSGAVIIPRKKQKSIDFCIVFYVFMAKD